MARTLSEQQQVLIASLADQPEIAGTFELVWRQARASLPPALLADWVAACRDIAKRIGANAAIGYIRNSPSVAAAAGPKSAMALAAVAPDFAARVGANATLALFVAAPQVARRLATAQAFSEWLRVIGRIAEAAPESVGLLLDRSARLLDSLDLRSYESWALGGIRSAENDPEKRLKFFALLDTRTLHALEYGADSVAFTDVERELKAFIAALWQTYSADPRIAARRLRHTAAHKLRQRHDPRAAIVSRFHGRSGKDLFRASLAHVLAHFQFTPGRFPLGSLKPVQIALVSLIEDARVEQLVLKELPGLRRFWLPFHLAEPSNALTAPALMTRLAHALLDPAYVDPHGWVNKGRDLFFAAAERWTDPTISRTIGSLLGNDLGQMRAQFNARTYVVEPAYRDDNHGLWDVPASAAEAGETLYESVRFEQSEQEPSDRERSGEGGSEAGQSGAAVRRGRRGRHPGRALSGVGLSDQPRSRRLDDRVGIQSRRRSRGTDRRHSRTLSGDRLSHRRLGASAAKVSRPVRVRRQREGDRLDLEATITAAIDLRAGPHAQSQRLCAA